MIESPDSYICTMKLVGPWIFIALYVVALARPLAPLLEYQANRDFFAEILCVNKAKPELKCNGKCALSKKLKKAFEDESQPTSVPSTIKLGDYPIGFVSLYQHSEPAETTLLSCYKEKATELITQGFLSDIFRPPCTA